MTNRSPQAQARRALLRLRSNGPAFVTFHGEYSIQVAELLHINCFYDGNCEPEAEMTELWSRRPTHTFRKPINLAAAE